jgi:hypothetical protein
MPEAGEGPSARADALLRDKAVLSEIDGLRGLAILAIIYQHGFSHGVARIFESYRVFPYLQGNGWQGVSLFFVLSGFVLARGFVGAQKNRRTPVTRATITCAAQGGCYRCSSSGVSSATSSIAPRRNLCCSR